VILDRNVSHREWYFIVMFRTGSDTWSLCFVHIVIFVHFLRNFYWNHNAKKILTLVDKCLLFFLYSRNPIDLINIWTKHSDKVSLTVRNITIKYHSLCETLRSSITLCTKHYDQVSLCAKHYDQVSLSVRNITINYHSLCETLR
jgi:hypothetical protein